MSREVLIVSQYKLVVCSKSTHVQRIHVQMLLLLGGLGLWRGTDLRNQ